MFYRPTPSEILEAARASVAALTRLGYDSCLLGGLACVLYGSSRTTEDVDIVVLDTTESKESLKKQMVYQDKRFYLVDSKSVFETYKVLWFRLRNGRSCKVDVLQPGVLDIPSIDAASIKHIDGLPVMPFLIVLLLKLYAWSDHRIALKSYLRQKQFVDVADITFMLPIAAAQSDKPLENNPFPKTFLDATSTRVKSYIALYPASTKHWAALGFPMEVLAESSSITAESNKIVLPLDESVTARTDVVVDAIARLEI